MVEVQESTAEQIMDLSGQSSVAEDKADEIKAFIRQFIDDNLASEDNYFEDIKNKKKEADLRKIDTKLKQETEDYIEELRSRIEEIEQEFKDQVSELQSTVSVLGLHSLNLK